MLDQLEFKRVPDVYDGQNCWFRIDKLEAHLHGKRVGYIRACWIKRSAFEEGGKMSDILGYVGYVKGEGRVQQYAESGDLHNCMSALSASYLPWRVHCEVDWKNEDEDVLREHFVQVFENIKDKHLASYERARGQAAKPYVDFVRVNSKWRKCGIGTEMYVQMAKWLAERDMVLHASSIQTDRAKAVWKSISRRLSAATVVKDVFTSDRLALDYRNHG